MKKIILLIILFHFSFFVSCGKPEGDFAFKLPEDRGYKKILSTPEFDSNVSVNWIFTLSSIRGKTDYGIIILKKELIWVDILSYTDYTDSEKQSIYGTIKDLEPGDYRLMITEIDGDDQRAISEIEFYVYTDEDIYWISFSIILPGSPEFLRESRIL